MARFRPLGLSCLLAGGLSAAPVYTYTATSVHVFGTIGLGVNVNASGPGFSLGGGFEGSLPSSFHVGDAVPLGMFYADAFDTGATVDFGGFTVVGINPLYGQLTVDAFSNSSFVIPPNPNSTYTFAAEATGEFTAVWSNNCDPLYCGSSANLLLSGPGELTLTVHPFLSSYEIEESFVGAAVPEPSSLVLTISGLVCAAGWRLRRK